jgi:hypothetical protein
MRTPVDSAVDCPTALTSSQRCDALPAHRLPSYGAVKNLGCADFLYDMHHIEYYRVGDALYTIPSYLVLLLYTVRPGSAIWYRNRNCQADSSLHAERDVSNLEKIQHPSPWWLSKDRPASPGRRRVCAAAAAPSGAAQHVCSSRGCKRVGGDAASRSECGRTRWAGNAASQGHAKARGRSQRTPSSITPHRNPGLLAVEHRYQPQVNLSAKFINSCLLFCYCTGVPHRRRPDDISRRPAGQL